MRRDSKSSPFILTEWRQQLMKFSGCCSSCVNFSKLSWAQCRRFPPPHRVIASTDSLALTSSSWAPSKDSGHWRLVARTCERERHTAIYSRPFSGCLSASRWYLADFRFSLIEIETILHSAMFPLKEIEMFRIFGSKSRLAGSRLLILLKKKRNQKKRITKDIVDASAAWNIYESARQ